MPEILQEEREEFLRHFPVSHETLRKLDRYAELVVEWNEKFNLIAESTIAHIWKRHFLDSAQLLKFIPASAVSLADLGSGAGFPGLVLGIMGNVQKTYLIESIGKKANFLNAVIAELKLDINVHNARIESLHNRQFDVITARALKPLPELLKLAKPLMKKESLGFFLKGQKLDAELTESAKYWKFGFETFPSISDAAGRIVKIQKLQSKNGRHK